MDIQPKLFLMLLAALVLMGCGEQRSADASGAPNSTAGMSATADGGDRQADLQSQRTNPNVLGTTLESTNPDVSEASLYAYNAVWTNQDGKPMVLGDFAGRPVLVSMIFTTCAHACPMIVHQMKQAAATLPEDVRASVHFILISVDPERDDPAALRRFADAHGLDQATWTLLRGDAEQVRMMAALLGVRYRQESDGRFAHTSLIALLGDGGEIVYRQKGTGGGSSDEIAAALRAGV